MKNRIFPRVNKVTLIGILVAVAVFGGIIWLARPTSPKLQGDELDSQRNIASWSLGSGGMLKAEETSFDFGTISMSGGKVRHQFKVKNAGSEPVTIEKLYSSCMCTTATFMTSDKKFGPYGMPGHGLIPKINKMLAPNEEAVVEAVFDPAAHGPAGVGRIERIISLENGGDQPLEFKISAVVTP